MRFRDKALVCDDCRRHFPFTAKDQSLYRELGFDAPKRCLICQKSREDQRRDAPHDHAASLFALSPLIASPPSRYRRN